MNARASGRRLLLLLVPAALLLSVRPASGSCAPPEIAVDRSEVRPGGRLEISGAGWAAACREPRDEGCGGDDRPAAPPHTDIRVLLVPKGDGAEEQVELGTVDAGDDYRFRFDVAVPDGTAPGVYRIEAGSVGRVSEPPVTIVVLRGPR